MADFRSRRRNYQTVTAGNITTTTLPIDNLGQIGAGIDPAPHADTQQQSDYSYQPPATYDNVYERRVSSRRPGRLGRTPFLYEMPVRNSDSSPPVFTGSGGGRTMPLAGAPDAMDLEIPQHGPWDPAKASNLPISTVPPNRSFWARLLGRKDDKGWFSEQAIPQMGRPDATEPDVEYRTDAALGQNSFIVPDVRATWNTPNVPGIGYAPSGAPYMAKAGRPTEDERFDPMRVEITNSRKPSPAGSLPFLPDRVRAGAAAPSEGRPAEIPHWWTLRPMDQLIAQRLTGQKGVMRQPLISRPIATSSELDADIAGYHVGQQAYRRTFPAPGLTPAGPQPNTVRQVPAPWDRDLTTPTVADTSTRTRRFGRR